MSELGAMLRQAREKHGYSLEDIQELTKIRKRYLEAIEEGNYAVLPGSFYVRAFVKNYAENVGLDTDEVLELYQKEVPTPAPEPVSETVPRSRRSSTQSPDRWSRWGFRALMWSFLILIVVIVYVFAINKPANDKVNTADDSTKMTDANKPPVETGKNEGAEKPGTNEQKPDKGEDTTVKEPVKPPNDTQLTFVRSTGKTDYYELTPGKYKIEFKTTGGGSWIGVSDKNSKGSYLLTQTMKDGEVATVEAAPPFYINIARANIVEVTIDGIVLEDGDKESTKKFQIDPASGTPSGGNGASTGQGATQ